MKSLFLGAVLSRLNYPMALYENFRNDSLNTNTYNWQYTCMHSQFRALQTYCYILITVGVLRDCEPMNDVIIIMCLHLVLLIYCLAIC